MSFPEHDFVEAYIFYWHVDPGECFKLSHVFIINFNLVTALNNIQMLCVLC